MLKRIVMLGLVGCVVAWPHTVAAQSSNQGLAQRVAALEQQLAAALEAIHDLQGRVPNLAGQMCPDGSFVVGFNAESDIICGTTFPVQDGILRFESEGFDLETGMVFEDFFFFPPEVDFHFAYNANRTNPTVLFQNQSSGVQILFLDGTPFSEVGTSTLVGRTFTTGLIDAPFDNDDTIVLRTSEGHTFKVGQPVLSGDGSAVSFVYQRLP
jgi:hypothetical protein